MTNIQKLQKEMIEAFNKFKMLADYQDNYTADVYVKERNTSFDYYCLIRDRFINESNAVKQGSTNANTRLN